MAGRLQSSSFKHIWEIRWVQGGGGKERGDHSLYQDNLVRLDPIRRVNGGATDRF